MNGDCVVKEGVGGGIIVRAAATDISVANNKASTFTGVEVALIPLRPGPKY